ncbi:MAG: GNAT family N-acetyltransferase [Actinomycetota bacterium]|nr:GNAT family N-acetyltransferase [Actinomycetota bacterium]
MSDGIDVRLAHASDVDSVAALLVELKHVQATVQPENPRYRVPDESWVAEAKTVLGDPGFDVFIAEQAGRVVGFAALRFARKVWGKACEVESLVVTEASRGRGVGEKLMEACEAHACAAGAAGMRLHVTPDNAGALRFYRRLGYETMAVRMGKSLTE